MDLTTIGIKLGYAVETVAGTKPTAFKQLKRCKSIAGIKLESDSVDTTALEDLIKQYSEGIADTGGKWELTFGVNDEVVVALTKLRTDSVAGKTTGKATWFDVWLPNLDKSFYVKAEPGLIPMPEFGVSSPAEIALSCIINEYIGLDIPIEPGTGATV